MKIDIDNNEVIDNFNNAYKFLENFFKRNFTPRIEAKDPEDITMTYGVMEDRSGLIISYTASIDGQFEDEIAISIFRTVFGSNPFIYEILTGSGTYIGKTYKELKKDFMKVLQGFGFQV